MGEPEASLIERLERELRSRQARRASPESYEIEAAVSLVLRSADSGGLEFLTIKRVELDGDPWSGHMALPGGRRARADRDLWGTAVRETREEVGLDLAAVGRRLGRLDDVRPSSRRLPAIVIAPYVAEVPAGSATREGPEVDRTLWVPLRALVDARFAGRLVLEGAERREFPTLEYGGEVIWGLTLSILGQFRDVLERAGGPVGEEES